MKLKMSTREDIKIVHVLEDIKEAQAPVLTAGILKLLNQEGASVILDLSDIRDTDETAMKALTQLKDQALETDGQLMIVSMIDEIADAYTVEHALEEIQTPLSKLLLKESRIKNKLKKIQHKKETLQNEIQSLGENLKNLKNLRKTQHELQKNIHFFETQIIFILKERQGKPQSFPAWKKQLQSISEILLIALEQEGVLPTQKG